MYKRQNIDSFRLTKIPVIVVYLKVLRGDLDGSEMFPYTLPYRNDPFEPDPVDTGGGKGVR